MKSTTPVAILAVWIPMLGIAVLTACANAPQQGASSSDFIELQDSAEEVIGEAQPRSAPPREVATRMAKGPITVGPHALRKPGLLRERPTPEARVIQQLPAGTAVDVVRAVKNATGVWTYVEFQSKEGWMLDTAF